LIFVDGDQDKDRDQDGRAGTDPRIVLERSPEMSRKVKLGLIGCGVIGHAHALAADTCADGDLVAAADLIPDRVRDVARKHKVPRTYESGDALLRDADVEAVVLALPTCGRLDLALKAFAAGKHVLTEKPVAMNAADVRRTIAARGRLVGACCSSRHRFTHTASLLEGFLASGALGALRLVRGRAVTAAGPRPTATPPDWRLMRALNGGGILMNWGCYDLDFLLGTCGWTLRPRLALASCWSIAPHLAARATPGSEAETHAVALVQCDDGIALSLERAEFTSSAPEQSHQFVGDKGTVRTSMTPGRKTVFHDHADGEFGVMTRVLWDGEEPFDPVSVGALHDFASAIAHGRAPKTTLEQALVVQQITDAIYASAATGRAVPIE
jgi:predicted dehydrogenase